MATNQKNKPAGKKRSYKGERVPSKELIEGSCVEGVFQGAKLISIQDQNTHEDKDVWQYTFRDEEGNKFQILGRTMLDNAFREVFEGEGSIERCQGLNMRIERGKDEKLSRNRTMGSYEISVWEG